jgi:hypothetical protein
MLLSSLLLGLAQAALIPPFEGFDEPAHYSYIQQIAETGRWPRRGERMSADIDAYLKVAPTTESFLAPWSYYRFFAGPQENIAAARETIHSPRTSTFAPGQIENYAAQHPPLYYLALAPAYLAVKNLSLAAQLFVLRALSYLLAWAALWVVALGALRNLDRKSALPVLFAAGAWPLLVPMWLPEMGRLGNDSLIALLAACLLTLSWRLAPPPTLRHCALIGLVLGLGLLTKATFLAAAAAIFTLLAVQTVLARRTPGGFSHGIKGLLLAATVMLAICGWWYLGKLIETGTYIGSSDVIRMHETGGMIAGLMKNARLEDVFSIPWAFVVSFLWAGTWSFVLPPRIYLLPLVAMLALSGYGIVRAMCRPAAGPAAWFSLMALGFFLAALSYQSAVLLATASGTAPAWYLHSIAPLLAVLVGYGVRELAQIRWLRPALAVLTFYPLLFLSAMTAMNALYFAGCAEKLPGRMYFARASAATCLAGYPRMLDNLSVLAYPALGLVLFISAGLLAVVAITIAIRMLAQTSITSTR